MQEMFLKGTLAVAGLVVSLTFLKGIHIVTFPRLSLFPISITWCSQDGGSLMVSATVRAIDFFSVTLGKVVTSTFSIFSLLYKLLPHGSWCPRFTLVGILVWMSGIHPWHSLNIRADSQPPLYSLPWHFQLSQDKWIPPLTFWAWPDKSVRHSTNLLSRR